MTSAELLIPLCSVAFGKSGTRRRGSDMLFRGGGGGGGGGGGCAAPAVGWLLVRYFSKKRSVDVKRINPKVPREEAKAISESLYGLIKQHGPISVSNTWNLIKEAGVNGLNSKTHMKIMLKWMRGRNMLKLFCTQHSSTKKFLHSTLPEEPQSALAQEDGSQALSSETLKSQKKNKIKKEYKRLLEPDSN